MDFTFKDLYVSLKMIQIAREKQEENLIALFNNNKTVASIEAISVEELEVKQQIYQNCLVEEVRSEDPKDFPMPKSVDAQLQAIKGLEIEVSAMRKLLKRTNDRLNSIKEDKFFLEKKRLGLKKMKQACLSVIENDGNQTYDKEIRITKHIFKQVKTDLNAVVEKLFPRNERMKDFLAHLSSAYVTGGDDVYIKPSREILQFVTYLLEIDVITLHRNDKHKVKLKELM